MDKDKVKFNLKNVHWVPTKIVQGLPEFLVEKPISWPGAVSLTMDPQGSIKKFFADGILYWRGVANNGYEGDLESALVPEAFRTGVLKERMDARGVLVENAFVEFSSFALLFEIDGDVKGRRVALYNCTPTRPGLNAKTVEEEKEPDTDSITITAAPIPKTGDVLASTCSQTDPDVYNAWFENVYYDPQATPSANLVSLSVGALTLVPEFDPVITVYTATTSNASNTVSAASYEGATVKITANGEEVANASAVTWEAGDNTVAIIVKNGDATKAYTVIVTKE